MLEEEERSNPPIAEKLSYCQSNCTYSAFSAAGAAEELSGSSNFRKGDSTMRTRIMFLSFCLVMTTIALAADINGQYQEDFISRRDMALVWTADVNGRWTAQVPGRDGQPQETTFTFKVEGDKLTGTVSGRQGDTPIADGKITGDEISFTVTRERQGATIKQLYKGKVAGSQNKTHP